MRSIYTFLLSLCFFSVRSQSDSLILRKMEALRYAQHIEEKIDKAENNLLTTSEKYINEFKKTEEKIRTKLKRIDPGKAELVFKDIDEKYDRIQQFMKDPLLYANLQNHTYLSFIDTLKTSLKFVNNINLASFDNVIKNKELTSAITRIEQLQKNFDKVDEVKKFITDREELLNKSLLKYGKIRIFKQYSRQAYYYKSKLEEYKGLLEQPDKILNTSVALLRQSSIFRKFFSNHSELASLFTLPGSDMEMTINKNSSLQTIETVKKLVQEKIGSKANVNSFIGQQMGASVSPVDMIKERMSRLKQISNTIEPPNFVPNSEKTKKKGERIEMGLNFQTVQAQGIFPVTTDFGISLGYRLNKKSIAGIGVAYKIGWGEGLNKIRITHQGVGLRSFVDVKLKGSIYVYGGAEINYRTTINSISQLSDYSAWQKSGLLGVTKKIAFKKKVNTTIQLLWDFLSYQQIPRTQPILLRVGYVLNK